MDGSVIAQAKWKVYITHKTRREIGRFLFLTLALKSLAPNRGHFRATVRYILTHSDALHPRSIDHLVARRSERSLKGEMFKSHLWQIHNENVLQYLFPDRSIYDKVPPLCLSVFVARAYCKIHSTNLYEDIWYWCWCIYLNNSSVCFTWAALSCSLVYSVWGRSALRPAGESAEI